MALGNNPICSVSAAHATHPNPVGTVSWHTGVAGNDTAQSCLWLLGLLLSVGQDQKGWPCLGVLEALWPHCEGICSGSVLTKGRWVFVWSQFGSTSSGASTISKCWCSFHCETARSTLLPLTSNWVTFISHSSVSGVRSFWVNAVQWQFEQCQ